jgi:folate-binding protein YgfZ
MQAEWLNFLTQAGAVPGKHGVVHCGDPERELRAAVAGDILCELSQQGLIAATDTDTETFLQGQFTNDVCQVTPEHSQLSAYCSPQGRMLASFRLFRRGGHYYLRMPREQLESVLKRLRMFVLRAKVRLEDASNDLVQAGLAGPKAVGLLQQALGAAPSQVDVVVQCGDITVIRVPGSQQPRFELYGGVEALKALWTLLASQVTPAGPEPWRLLDILAGIPAIYAATTEAFVPQMVNLQLLNGVSFRKGCYTGQEVVARTQHLGKLKRRLYRARVDTPIPPKAGDGLVSLQMDTEQTVGTIVDACRHPEGGYEVLAVVLIDCAENGTVLLGNAQEARLKFVPLPYAFEESGA